MKNGSSSDFRTLSHNQIAFPIFCRDLGFFHVKGYLYFQENKFLSFYCQHALLLLSCTLASDSLLIVNETVCNQISKQRHVNLLKMVLLSTIRRLF